MVVSDEVLLFMGSGCMSRDSRGVVGVCLCVKIDIILLCVLKNKERN